jgi:glycosyltransferase involved in cell wall biosynthesis
LYAAFDRFPSPKGAGIHINHVARTLFDVFGGGLLYVLGDEELPVYQREEEIEIVRYSRRVENFLERALGYSHCLSRLLDQQKTTLEVCQFRDPWGGVPILAENDRGYKTIYEINGLPSIELPYAYPQVGSKTLMKIREMERFCWSSADRIVTPSLVMRDNLIALGVPAEKITVIPNGAEIPSSMPRPANAPARYLLYFGALQSWQGVDILFRAFARLADLQDLQLVICSSSHPRQAKGYEKLAEKLEIAERVLWFFRLPESDLAPWRAHALLSVAPLTECSRNLDQGCCPLKILESMASGVPVVASDLPCVRELIEDGVDGRLVRADRPAELARAIRVLLEYPDRVRAMGRSAREKIAQTYTWAQAMNRMAALYHDLRAERPNHESKGETISVGTHDYNKGHPR